MIARVEPLSTARGLRGPFDYRAGDLAVEVGSLLLVPFARRELLGVVVEVTSESELDESRLLAPRRLIEPGLPAGHVALADWIAREYCSTRARALALMLPPGSARGTRASMRVTAELTDLGRAALRDGQEVRLTAAQRALLERLSEAGPLAATASGASHDALSRLRTRGLIELDRRVSTRRPANLPVGARPEAPTTLTAAQRAVLEPVRKAIDAGRHEAFLLHGVTGSGKTEVYLQAAARALERGTGVIVLVPEIGLTPQTVGRFIDRFGDTVAVLHSRLAAGERYDEWLRLRRGEARICVGPRSAAFAPIQRLGLIVVDEEHDPSYKHEGDPRYDARHIAAHRARESRAVLLAGTATPRPESWQRLRRLDLPARVDARPLPPVEVLDMREAAGALHPRTAAALRAVTGKAIVLLNRRGWSNFLSCRSCGRVWGCPQCDVALVLHRAESLLACHHCGHREPLPASCPDCSSTSVARHGLGTERLEHELAGALAPEVPIFRLDSDVAEGKGRAAALLRRFDRAPAGVLVGTQMVAKGHDFEGIELGVVLDADATLRFPDFRSEERTFALVCQLAGRAGRGGSGTVLVQTMTPAASSIAHAARHDSAGFLREELERRAALNYPPYGELIRVVCSSPQPGAALAAAAAFKDQLRIPVLGPAPLFRLRGRERAQLLIKTQDRVGAVRVVGAAVDSMRLRDFAISVDVDPQ
ncbi:MAG: replication restart helicase PriA [Solirubrobacteraceae bacterium]